MNNVDKAIIKAENVRDYLTNIIKDSYCNVDGSRNRLRNVEEQLVKLKNRKNVANTKRRLSRSMIKSSI